MDVELIREDPVAERAADAERQLAPVREAHEHALEMLDQEAQQALAAVAARVAEARAQAHRFDDQRAAAAEAT